MGACSVHFWNKKCSMRVSMLHLSIGMNETFKVSLLYERWQIVWKKKCSYIPSLNLLGAYSDLRPYLLMRLLFTRWSPSPDLGFSPRKGLQGACIESEEGPWFLTFPPFYDHLWRFFWKENNENLNHSLMCNVILDILEYWNKLFFLSTSEDFYLLWQCSKFGAK